MSTYKNTRPVDSVRLKWCFKVLSSFPNLSHRLDKCGTQRTTICLKEGACWSHEDRVHCFRMKNITLSADEQLIEQARLLAKSQHKTLNAMFREWLEQFTTRSGGTQEFDALMKRLKHVQAGRRFSRDEMNER
jgi:hypothetical protein